MTTNLTAMAAAQSTNNRTFLRNLGCWGHFLSPSCACRLARGYQY